MTNVVEDLEMVARSEASSSNYMVSDIVQRGADALKAALATQAKDEVDLYLEAHVTIEPVFGQRREQAAEIAKQFKFRLAELLMKKERDATEERSDKDTFMTGHSKSKRDIINRTAALCRALKQNGFKVWRYKIEDTLVDSKYGIDVWGLL
jgi:hypothetical protein